MSHDRTVLTEGAEIAFRVSGSGPVLLTIAGGGGTGARYDALRLALGPDVTAVSYDRRCCGQSGGDRDQPLDMGQQARDALAVLDALGAERAHVFGNSGGGNIALKLAETAPLRMGAVVVHEPPVLSLLDDGANWIEYSERIVASFAETGPLAALQLFMSEVKGVKGPPPGPRPDPRDMAYFLSHELAHICRYVPDISRLDSIHLTVAAGQASENAYYVRATRVLAQKTGVVCKDVPGHHFSYADRPDAFAGLIRKAIEALPC